MIIIKNHLNFIDVGIDLILFIQDFQIDVSNGESNSICSETRNHVLISDRTILINECLHLLEKSETFVFSTGI